MSLVCYLLHYTAYHIILTYKTTNIYNKEEASHKKSIAQLGKKPKKIVGIINANIKNDSLLVQSAVKLI